MYFRQLWTLILWKVSQLIKIEPFITVDRNEYCPACGGREGSINAVALAQPDPAGSKVGVLHKCKVCGFAWTDLSVSIITQHCMEQVNTEEEQVRKDTAQLKTRKAAAMGY